jgi:adenylosuccinate lyase
VTFGFKLLVWVEEVRRHIERTERAIDVMSVGRISGSVGTYIHLDPRVETYALRKLKLRPAPVSTQVLQRDRHAEVMAALALTATSLEKFAIEIRHLQRTEVREVGTVHPGTEGSSSMPQEEPRPLRAHFGARRIIRANLPVAWRTSLSGTAGHIASRPSGSSSG